jgi:hypothetical protein
MTGLAPLYTAPGQSPSRPVAHSPRVSLSRCLAVFAVLPAPPRIRRHRLVPGDALLPAHPPTVLPYHPTTLPPTCHVGPAITFVPGLARHSQPQTSAVRCPPSAACCLLTPTPTPTMLLCTSVPLPPPASARQLTAAATATVCPTCSNMLRVSKVPPGDPTIDDYVGQNRFECLTCPYHFVINKRYYERKYLKKKEVEDILGGKGAWDNVDKTQGQCLLLLIPTMPC